MADSMAKYRGTSATYHQDHLAKLKAYQGFEKGRAKAQADGHATHQAAMDAIHTTTLERNAADEAKTRASW